MININGKDYQYTCAKDMGKEYKLIVHNFAWLPVYGHSVEHCLNNFKLQFESQSINNFVTWK
jgi:hypothetical protein